MDRESRDLQSAVGIWPTFRYPGFNPSVFSQPALGYIGTAAEDVFRDAGQNEWDLSVFKNFRVFEKGQIQFRGELYFFSMMLKMTRIAAAKFDSNLNQINALFGQVTPGDTVCFEARFLNTGE